MADAVARGLPLVATPNTLIVWGDQVALRPESLDTCIRLHTGPAQAAATCPTLVRDRPYIHFLRDDSGRVVKILHAREGDVLPDRGESDAGVFFFRTETLREELPKLLQDPQARGAKTEECNFLPILTRMQAAPGGLLTPCIMTEAESVGVNSRSDAEYLEGVLKLERHA
jgi:bifunctional N-acetylglucosamine-1-phosphate-uridyltransferase/glucosamine-1-phosphate-acetyltransferase GlmU-like protein